MISKLLAAFVGVCAAWAVQAQTPTHHYRLDGSYADDLGGPSLTPLGGTLGSTGYAFGADQGLTVDGVVNEAVYTIDLAFSFDELSGYRRIIDFQNQASDTGLYVYSGDLNFYNEVTGSGTPFAALEMTRVTVTRDATGLFVGYVNGVQQVAFIDAAALATFSGPTQMASFFRDDLAVPGEASAGFVDDIRIYGSALSAAEVAALPTVGSVPEPAAAVLLLAGLLLVFRRARRR